MNSRSILTAIFLVTALVQVVSAAAGTVPGTDIKYTAEYPETRTTVYITAECETSDGEPVWCSPAHESCITSKQEIRTKYPNKASCLNQGKGWCCIPSDERGFYEEVRCQGSGACLGKTFHTSEITPEPMSNPVKQQETGGQTVTGATPEKQVTIATNDDPSSDCYLPTGSEVYINFGPNSDWNGKYVAEDIGSAIDEKAPNGNCKIDVYGGIGPSAKENARAQADRQSASVYILKWGDNTTEPSQINEADRPADTTITRGFLNSQYTYSHSIPILQSLRSKVEKVRQELQKCEQVANHKECALNALKQEDTRKWKVSSTCNPNRKASKIAQDKYIISRGEIEYSGEITVGDANTKASRVIGINTSKQRYFETLTLRSDSIGKLTLTKGQTIAILHPQQLTPQNEFDFPTINLDGAPELKKLKTKTDLIIRTLLNLANCQTSDERCICQIHNDLETDIELQNNTAKAGNTFNEQPYFFNVSDGEGIPTKITSDFLNDKEKSLSLDPIATSLVNLKEKPKEPVILESKKDSYFLFQPSEPASKVQTDIFAKLSEKPIWFKGAKDQVSYRKALRDALKGIQAVNNPTSIIQDQTPSVPACRPTKLYQSVCIQQNQTAKFKPPISIPPVKFVDSLEVNQPTS
jgi:3D (Asp-Asp-Asp) domain-containing protein